MGMRKWLDIIAAVFAFAAAVFWFLSAYGKLPPMITYWGSTPESDPYYQAVKFSALMNRWASGLSGASALCMGLKLLIDR
jgi:Na+/proline symporter